MEKAFFSSGLTGDPVPRRFGVALAGSVLLHFVLLLGMRVTPYSGPEDVRQVMIPARLMDVSLPSKPAEPAPAAVATPEPAPTVKQAEAAPVSPPQSVPQPAPPPPAPAPPSALPEVNLPLAEDPTFYPASKVDVHPQAMRKIEPVYPAAAADAGVQGEVTLLLLIDEYGAVKEASVVDAKPEGWFEESALEAFKNARFRPAERKGRVVKSRVVIRVHFELNGNGSAGQLRNLTSPVR